MILAPPAAPFGKLTAGSAGTARATVFKEPCHSGIEKAPDKSVHPFSYTAQQATTNKTPLPLEKERLMEKRLRRRQFSELSFGMYPALTAH